MSKKSTTTTKPWAQAQPYVLGAAGNVQSTVAGAQPNLDAVGGGLSSGFGDVASRAFSADPNVSAAQGYNTSVLGGKYLDAGNPYMTGMLDTTNQDVTNSVNSVFGASGRTGSDAHMYGLTRGLADADNNLQFSNYNAERQAMGAAAGQAGGLASAQYAGVMPAVALGSSAAETPYLGSKYLSSGISGLLSPYTSSTQQNSFGQNLQNLLIAGAATASKFAAAGG